LRSFLLIVFYSRFDAEEEAGSTILERRQRLFIARFDYKIEELTATTTIENLGRDSPLDYVSNIGRQGMTTNTVMSNAFAFGGAKAALIAGKMKGWE
jgi:hypothetical protein